MSKNKYLPVSGEVTPRYAGIPTFMRLRNLSPEDDAAKSDIDVGIVGVPWDGGTTNRPGARHGPRQMRDMSTMMRNVHHMSGIRPFHSINVADLGDSPVNPIDLLETMDLVEGYYKKLCGAGIIPLTAGGDHLITLPIMRAIVDKSSAGKPEPMGMVHFDAHTDTWDRYFGDSKYTHGTPFRRAIEEGLLDPKRTVQIGIRGALYTKNDKSWGLAQGIRVIEIEEYFDLGHEKVIEIAKDIVGSGKTYLSFDIDCLDPVYAPGTGTPEIGGISTYEAQSMIRNLQGINIIGADMVEVSPPFDTSGITALTAMTMMWEILCIISSNITANDGSKKQK